jgi:hypothetical protein
MLASVRATDPAFPAARYELGRIGLRSGDTALALRYFESAGRHADAVHLPALLLGRWEALRANGQWDEATGVERELTRAHPQSLAVLVLRDLLRAEQEQNEAERFQAPVTLSQTASAAIETPAVGSAGSGHTSVQLAAFSDRALALAFQERWRPTLPELRVDREFGPNGQPLYKVRTGRYASRAQANAEAERIGDRYEVEVLVVEINP